MSDILKEMGGGGMSDERKTEDTNTLQNVQEEMLLYVFLLRQTDKKNHQLSISI